VLCGVGQLVEDIWIFGAERIVAIMALAIIGGGGWKRDIQICQLLSVYWRTVAVQN
jgi:hypothetical protein